MQNRIYNFSAGPSMLPLSVLEEAAAEMTNYRSSGMSVMEMSHRSKVYLQIFDSVKADLKRILQVPDTHEILFMQGGASMQFSAIPLNLMGPGGSADYAITGNFANNAAKEAKKYGTVRVAASTEATKHTTIPTQQELDLDPNASSFYYCANNTIFGTEWQYVPDTGSVPVCCDMSSNILSRKVDVSKYGVLFAGVQKNMAPAGMAVVIIRKDLAGKELPFTPLMLTYKTMIEKDSMFNTPPCYTIYMLGLVLKWVDQQGGLDGMEKLRALRSGILYDYLDQSSLFHGIASKEARSGMNVTFRTDSKEMDDAFVKAATEAGFSNLAGHRIAGGMRASIYNAMPVEGVEKLVDFMRRFEQTH